MRHDRKLWVRPKTKVEGEFAEFFVAAKELPTSVLLVKSVGLFPGLKSRDDIRFPCRCEVEPYRFRSPTLGAEHAPNVIVLACFVQDPVGCGSGMSHLSEREKGHRQGERVFDREQGCMVGLLRILHPL